MRGGYFLLFVGLGLAALLSACSNLSGSPKATVDYNRSYDFSRVHEIARR